MDILSMIGIEFPPDKKESIPEDDDDQHLCESIQAAMSQSLKDRWETVALQIQTVLHEATRIRSAAEGKKEGDKEDGGGMIDESEPGEAVAALFDEADSTRGGLSQQVLKSSVIFAAKEVSKYRRVHVTWRKSTDARIERLLAASEEAEHCQQQLLAAEAQLAELRGDSKAKSKGVLMSMAEGQNTALVHSVFSSWFGWIEKVHAEAQIRKRFQDQIDHCYEKLIVYKEAQMANVRGVIMRGAMEEQDVLMHMVWKFWHDDVLATKADGDTADQLKALQDKMNNFEAAQRENAGKFMTRMAAGSEESLKNLCLEAWIKFHQDYASHREEEDRVKEAEKKFKEHMDAKKDEAKAVLDRMLAASDHGLLSLIIQNWASWLKDEKKQKELEFALNEAESKFKSLNARQRGGAHGVQNRVNEQQNLNLLQRVFNFWLIETKANRIESHYNNKYESKRRQLQGVQNLFKSFALQLEQNLGGDDDSSARSQRRTRKSSAGMAKGADGTVSLPAIPQKAAA